MRLATISLLALVAIACNKEPQVTIYCSLDQVYSEPILRDFEKQSGIKVNAVFDIEANKTVGLVRTILEEKSRPRCDVFWNNEIAQTIRLKKAGVLTHYNSPNAKEIPQEFRDPEGHWTGFAARARVFIVNTQKLSPEDLPSSLLDLANPKWSKRFILAKPLTGTTLTHFAALFATWGEEKTKQFCEDLLRNTGGLANGNAHVSKLVAKGEFAFGLTDTDDVQARIEEGAPVRAVYPDADGDGALVIPNTVSLVAGGPNPELGKKLIDWILRAETEARLAEGGSAQIPLRPGVPHPARVKVPGDFRSMKVDWIRTADEIDRRSKYFQETFTR